MILHCLAAVSLAVAPASAEPDTVFKIKGRTFTGTNSEVCDIKGKWSDGEHFFYQAWDSCKKMTVEWVPPKNAPEIVEQVHGRDRKFVIPAGSEGFRFSNDHSAVWVFRNIAGEMEEILISD